MKPDYKMYGWHLSYYSGKLRAYLRYKQLNFQDKAMSAVDLLHRAPKKTGVTAMPILETKSGEWLQDTSAIIRDLEQRHPQRSVMPNTPVQRFAAELFEAWADEWWIPVAMHYRWSFADNYPLFEHDAGKALLPFAPKFLRNRVVKQSAAGKMRSYLPAVGITPEQTDLLEQWTEQTLDLLEEHLAQHPYLFGGRPCIADYGLIGCLYGHLSRDPVPKRMLLDSRPHLQAWVTRTHNGDETSGDWLADDEIPATLAPIFQLIFTEFLPQARDIAEAIENMAKEKQLGAGGSLPRSFGAVTANMAGGRFTRRATPYTVWMLQEVVALYGQMPAEEQASVNDWLQTQEAKPPQEWLVGPRLAREGLGARLV
jgi:glutathione S-transferase